MERKSDVLAVPWRALIEVTRHPWRVAAPGLGFLARNHESFDNSHVGLSVPDREPTDSGAVVQETFVRKASPSSCRDSRCRTAARRCRGPDPPAQDVDIGREPDPLVGAAGGRAPDWR
jgi:hypothetical protein